MPDLASRTEHEDEVALLILLYLQEIEASLREGAVPDWDGWANRLGDDIAPVLAVAFLASGAQLKERFGLGVSVQMEQQAAEWASRQAQGIAQGVANRTRLAVAETEATLLAEAEQAILADLRAAQQAVHEAATMEARLAAEAEFAAAREAISLESTLEVVRAEIPKELEWLFSEERAESIGITETTNSLTEGESAGAREVQGELGVTLKPYWHTEADDKVCPICRPLDGRPQEEWWAEFGSGPPAHPRCRCTLEWREES